MVMYLKEWKSILVVRLLPVFFKFMI